LYFEVFLFQAVLFLIFLVIGILKQNPIAFVAAFGMSLVLGMSLHGGETVDIPTGDFVLVGTQKDNNTMSVDVNYSFLSTNGLDGTTFSPMVLTWANFFFYGSFVWLLAALVYLIAPAGYNGSEED